MRQCALNYPSLLQPFVSGYQPWLHGEREAGINVNTSLMNNFVSILKWRYPSACLMALMLGLVASCGGGSSSNAANVSNPVTGGAGNAGGMNSDCPAMAVYQVSFQSRWSSSSHGSPPPGSAHFTTLVGATHNAQVTFWESGGLATPGVEGVAELGSTGTFRNTDVANAMAAGNARDFISIGGLGRFPSQSTGMVMTTEDFPLLTLISMIAPSPDWFVGVSGLNLKGSNGCWRASIPLQLTGYDAGTETGLSFSLINPAESPHKPIGPITALPANFRNVPFASLTLTLQ